MVPHAFKTWSSPSTTHSNHLKKQDRNFTSLVALIFLGIWCFIILFFTCVIFWSHLLVKWSEVTIHNLACNFTKINTPLWVFFTFFKLYKWYQIAQRTTDNLGKQLFQAICSKYIFRLLHTLKFHLFSAKLNMMVKVVKLLTGVLWKSCSDEFYRKLSMR